MKYKNQPKIYYYSYNKVDNHEIIDTIEETAE